MSKYHLQKLQNGSDIRGVAISGVSGEEVNLTIDAAERLSKGFLIWLSLKTKKPIENLHISIGRDPRLSGEVLESAAARAIMSAGGAVYSCGLASTPAMFMSTVFPEYSCDGAIMITASHLPFNRNGFKYFDKDGGLNKGDISKIIEYAEKELEEVQNYAPLNAGDNANVENKIKQIPLMDTYCAHLRNLIIKGVPLEDENKVRSLENLSISSPNTLPLKGLKIVVDAGNGSGGFYAYKVLAPLGADVSGSQFLEADGHFPNHAPNPEDKKAMESISKQVLKTKSDFGLIFDTDVDRSAAVDKNGREIARNAIVAMAAALIKEEYPNTTIVTDSITSDQLGSFLTEKLGLHHLRFKRGYKNVINKAIELNNRGIDSQLAIETSGHAALKENYFLDDGAYLATKIVIKAAKLMRDGQTLDVLIEDLEEAKETLEVRFPITIPDFAPYADKILDDLKVFIENQPATLGMAIVQPNYEGIRISFDEKNGHGWCLLRKSLHDPIMPLNIESNIEGGNKIIAGKMKSFLQQYENLDVSNL